MNRITLEKRKDKSNAYWINDILDGKKIGKVKIKHGKLHYKLKSKCKNKFIETETSFLLKQNNKTSFSDFYQDSIGRFIGNVFDLGSYNYPLFLESCRLKSCGKDMFNRKSKLHPAARKAWRKMQQAAKSNAIDLQIISAFRSLDYQKKLIDNKLAKGIKVKEILKVNTLPGFSEHHTGCAIDIGSDDEPILEQTFENSDAFKWLVDNAHKFNYYMNYPKDNTTGICYEPWHWCFIPKIIFKKSP